VGTSCGSSDGRSIGIGDSGGVREEEESVVVEVELETDDEEEE
jgi:hypothetical protein